MEMPLDPTLLLAETETSSPHSFESSFDDFSHEQETAGETTSSPSLIFGATSAPTATTISSTLPWQPIPWGPAAPSISLEPPTPVTAGAPSYTPSTAMPMSNNPLDSSSQRKDSGHSSAPSEEDAMSERGSYSGTTTVHGKNPLLSNAYDNSLSREAPFDLPEHARVHDVIIGPEKEDGSWILMFRKLQGLEADWDVTTDYVAVV